MKAVVYFANLPIQGGPYFFNNFNFERFCEKLAGNDNQFNDILRKFYTDDREGFKMFFKELYRTAEGWRFMFYFASYLIKEPMSGSVEIYYDTRNFRKKTNDYPYKLRIYHARVSKLFPTIFGLSKEDHEKLTAKKPGPRLHEYDHLGIIRIFT
jgi:hypothetical protein